MLMEEVFKSVSKSVNVLPTPVLQPMAEFASLTLRYSPLGPTSRDGGDTVRHKKVTTKGKDFRDVSSGVLTSTSSDPRPRKYAVTQCQG